MEDERNTECICNLKEVIKKLETAARHIQIGVEALRDVEAALRGKRKVRLRPEPTCLVPPEPTGQFPREPSMPLEPAESPETMVDRMITARASAASSSSPPSRGSRAGRSPSP